MCGIPVACRGLFIGFMGRSRYDIRILDAIEKCDFCLYSSTEIGSDSITAVSCGTVTLSIRDGNPLFIHLQW